MKMLVAYATRAGSTEGVAQAVGKTLREAGLDVDVTPVSQISDLTSYEAIVLGSAIRAGKPLSEAVRFVRAHSDELEKLPVALFAVCLLMGEDTEKNRAEAEGYLAPLKTTTAPVDIGLFAGSMDTKKLGCLLGPIFAAVFRFKGMKQEDSRDWDKISAWAKELAPKLARNGT